MRLIKFTPGSEAKILSIKHLKNCFQNLSNVVNKSEYNKHNK